MKVLNKRKRYNVLDFVRIPIKVCPLYTMIIFCNRVILALVPAINLLITASFIDAVIDEVLNDKNTNFLLYLIAYILVILYCHIQGVIIVNFINVRYDMKMFKVLQSDMLDKTASLQYKHMENPKTIGIIERVTSNPLGDIANGMNNVFDIVELVVRIGSIVVIVWRYTWWIAIILVFFVCISAKISMYGGKHIYDARKKTQDMSRKAGLYSYMLSARDCVDERRMFGYVDEIGRRWYKEYDNIRKENLKVAIKNDVYLKGFGVFTILVATGIMLFMLDLLNNGIVSSGMFISLSGAVFELTFMISGNLATITRGYSTNKEYLKELNEFMMLTEQEGALEERDTKESVQVESIEFVNVRFKYPDTDRYILDGLNFKMEKGKKYAFVGLNGAGKTTIVKLLTRLYSDYEGEILINGKNIALYSMKEIKAMFGVAFQEYAMFCMEAEQNIKIADLKAFDKNRYEKALEISGAKNIFERLPFGERTKLGRLEKEGVDLSGGQWQRISLARNIYCSAQIKIMDEPTASLDPIEESEIYKMFSSVGGQAITILITHRLGAARLVDEILVMDNGKICEKGNHEQLMELGGLYSMMFMSQKEWYEGR